MSVDQEHRYALAYMLIPQNPPASKSELARLSMGGCDSCVFILITHSSGQTEMLDGSTEQGTHTVNGKTGEELSPGEIFQAWTTLAAQLADRLPEGSWQKQFAQHTHNEVKRVIAEIKAEKDSSGQGTGES